MSYDDKVPLVLKKEQQWFGGIISRPIDEDSKMNPISPTGQSMEVEAALHIAPSPTMRPAQRIQIYNQQYWWRLLNTMHDTFPLVTRLFGYFDFNRTIAIPYLAKYNPRHWSLNLLGDRLTKWIEEEYQAADKELVCNSVLVDWAFTDAFVTGQVTPLACDDLSGQNESSEIFSKDLYLQPYVHIFKMDYDLFKYRMDFIKEDPDYWLNNEFPVLDRSKQFYFVLYRTPKNDVAWKEITEGEYLILKLIKQGSSIDHVCEWLEGQEEAVCNAAILGMQTWFQEWSMRGWLSLTRYVAGDLDAGYAFHESVKTARRAAPCCVKTEGLQPVCP